MLATRLAFIIVAVALLLLAIAGIGNTISVIKLERRVACIESKGGC